MCLIPWRYSVRHFAGLFTLALPCRASRPAISRAPLHFRMQVGIHERSAREKISHVMKGDERSGQAHIMNDEATRKYFQAIKRLITNMQRLYPTGEGNAHVFAGPRFTPCCCPWAQRPSL